MLDNPYIKACIVAFLSAIILTLYMKIQEPTEKKLAMRFAQVFVSTLAAGILIVFTLNDSYGGEGDMMTDPFIAGGLADF